jgi:hypothetical protein
MPWIEKAERLEAQNAQLIAALEVFGQHATNRCADSPEWDSHNSITITVTIGDLRRARAALAAATGGKGE